MQKTEIVFDDILIFKSFLKALKLVGFVFFVYMAYICSSMLLCECEILCCNFFRMKCILTKRAPGNPWLYLLTEELGPVYLHV